MKPLGNTVLIKEIEEDDTENGIIIIKTHETQKGIVVSLGTDFVKESNPPVMRTDVNIGDIIRFKVWAGIDIVHEGERYKIVPAEDLLIRL